MRNPRAAGEALSAISCQQSAFTGILLMADGCRRLIQKARTDPGVRIDAPIPQERPPAAHFLDTREIDLRDQDRLTILRGFGDDRAERIRQERRAPELDPVAGSPPLTRMPVLSFPLSALRRGGQGVRSGPLVAHAVHRGDVTAVGDAVAALDGAPGVELLGAVGRLLLRVPADGCRITEEGGALQRGETRALRIPLIPAH